MDKLYQMGIKRIFAIKYLIILWLIFPTVALAQSPVTTTVTINEPPLGTGTLYINLISATNTILQPLDDFAISSHAMVTESAAATATTAAGSIGNLFGFLEFFSTLGLSFGFLVTPIMLYFLIKLVKISLSAIKYLKQLIAQWV